MATTNVVNVKVEELTKYGFKANGRYVNYSKNLSETDKTKVVPGVEFEAEFYVSDGGKEYLNKVLNTSITIPDAVNNASQKDITVDVARAKKFTPKFEKKAPSASEGMTKADWSAKDRNMMIGGRSHDAAVIVAALIQTTAVGDSDVVLKTYQYILQGMLKIAEEVK